MKTVRVNKKISSADESGFSDGHRTGGILINNVLYFLSDTFCTRPISHKSNVCF